MYEILEQIKILSEFNNNERVLSKSIGDGGQNLSGGQAQRVAVARALYHGRQVLILDEATSALDRQSEINVMSSINSMKGRITIFITTHNVRTLEKCDKIYKINNGKIYLVDSYEELLNWDIKNETTANK